MFGLSKVSWFSMVELSILQQSAKAIRLFGSNVSEVARFSRGPKLRSFAKRMETPVFGDLVFEVTTAYKAADDQHINAVGYLIKQENDEALIQRFDGGEERWRNSLFYAIPGEREVGKADELVSRAKEFAAEGQVCSLNHLAKVVRFFGFNTYETMISPSGKTHDIYQRMKHPNLGDLIFEVGTTFWANNDAHLDAVGYLVEKGSRSSRTSRESPTRILTLDGREFAWRNATFFAIPAELEIEDQPTEEERFLRGDYSG
ncbi:hypothetical protein [Rhizobium sp. MHM7A]|uniref:hypothetical protein n=1 Tax=Rhizobium sp. MHM7A TaxID=2583233 RepID=UPI001107515D|nr:hypothetical protein [Rhizobium sp. MHM7A]TLX16040.1 hypothetical protein FFR93_01600 [Rhizobium sp. MHM7A]